MLIVGVIAVGPVEESHFSEAGVVVTIADYRAVVIDIAGRKTAVGIADRKIGAEVLGELAGCLSLRIDGTHKKKGRRDC